MDMLSPPPSPPSKLGQWPDAPAQPGKFYSVNDPIYPNMRLVVMLLDTWTDVGTIIESQKRTLAKQDATIKALQASNAALAAQANDANQRIVNLRRVRRKEMRADLEKTLAPIPAPDTTPKFL